MADLIDVRVNVGASVAQFSVWVGVGLVTTGVLAAMIAGAAVAAADTDSPSSDSTSSDSTSSESSKPDTKPTDADKVSKPSTKPPADDDSKKDESKKDDSEKDGPTTDGDQTSSDPAPDAATVANPSEPEVRIEAEAEANPVKLKSNPVAAEQPATPGPTATPRLAATPVRSQSEAAVVAPPQPTVIGVVSSIVFNVLQTVERIVTGPPVLPPNSTVTVRSSTLTIGNGLVVPADWYYPAGDQPTQLILLQHGFLAIGPMYSHTAANLAERTHSIVVAPTLTSNPFADGGFWLGGAGMHQAIADLFVGEWDALTASALAAGYAQQYGLGPTAAVFPQQFALAGHSLGGALVSGVAGYLADNGAADQLAGVILLDGVPTGDQLPGALVKLAAYEARTGHYVPVREIGAPLNVWNSLSNANEALTTARPNNFNGVVLDGGVHMDSMQGGNPLIQFAAYLAAGFPQAQNPPAVQQLAVTWLEQWFAGNTHVGDRADAGYLVPGSAIEIDTPAGPARGVVIGNPPAVVASSTRTRQLVA